MRVRFLSGNLAGCEQDLPRVEAEVAIATGYAEAAPEPPPADLAVADAQADETPQTDDPPQDDPPGE